MAPGGRSHRGSRWAESQVFFNAHVPSAPPGGWTQLVFIPQELLTSPRRRDPTDSGFHRQPSHFVWDQLWRN